MVDRLTIGVDHYSGQPIRMSKGLSPRLSKLVIETRGDQDAARVDTTIPSVIRGLLEIPEFDVERVGLQAGHVVSLRGTIPVGSLSIMQARNTNGHHRIVSNTARMPRRRVRMAKLGRLDELPELGHPDPPQGRCPAQEQGYDKVKRH